VTFESACALVESALAGPFRRQVIEAASSGADARTALERIRGQMRSHRWSSGGRRVAMDALVTEYDERSRRDGLHVLNDWDGKALHVNRDTIAVDVASYLVDRSGSEPPDPRTLGILIDYYFIYVLALLVVHVWDDEDSDTNFDRLARLLDALQGPDGSGERFVGDVETLLLIAGSHFEQHEDTYDRLLDRVRTLSLPHRRRVALTHAAGLGSHLRFGLEATYNKDIGLMRDDNVVDYLWLSFSLATLAEAWPESDPAGLSSGPIVEAFANGLSADPHAFFSARPPSVLARCTREIGVIRNRLDAARSTLAEALAPYRPVRGAYAPLALFFNFSQNVLKGSVVDATLWGDPRGLSLDALLTGLPRDPAEDARKLRLVDTLMAFARTSPDRIRGRLTPVIVYDLVAGRRAFGALMRALTAFGVTA
jgi:hypothetical protein